MLNCSRPGLLPYSDSFGRPIFVPCRTCPTCRSSRVSEWTQRLKYEFNHCSSASFVTLTYDDIHLEYEFNDRSLPPSLRRRTFHRYIDSLRHWCQREVSKNSQKIFYGVNPHFTYFACGEYGSDTNRPHYHVIIFGMNFQTCRKIFKTTWKYGNVDVRPAQVGAIRYVLKYMHKQVFGKMIDDIYTSHYVEPPFFSFTPGIGSGLYSSHQYEISKYGWFTNGAKKLFPNRYYSNKLSSFSDFSVKRRMRYLRDYEDENWQKVKPFHPDCRNFQQYREKVARLKADSLISRDLRNCSIVLFD